MPKKVFYKLLPIRLNFLFKLVLLILKNSFKLECEWRERGKAKKTKPTLCEIEAHLKVKNMGWLNPADNVSSA